MKLKFDFTQQFVASVSLFSVFLFELSIQLGLYWINMNQNSVRPTRFITESQY